MSVHRNLPTGTSSTLFPNDDLQTLARRLALGFWILRAMINVWLLILVLAVPAALNFLCTVTNPHSSLRREDIATRELFAPVLPSAIHGHWHDYFRFLR